MIATIHKLPTMSIEQHTKRVKQLMEDWSRNTIELGRELKQTRDEKFPALYKRPNPKRPGWQKWLKDVGISTAHANCLIRVADKFADARQHVGISRSILVLLSRPSTADEAFNEVVRRVKTGEQITTRKAKKIIDKHRPKPAEANKIAKETGKAVVASDGYIYLGADKEEVKEATAKRTAIFALRNAIEVLAAIQVSPQQFLDMAHPHQLLRLNEGNQINRAAMWLVQFARVWKRRK